MHFNILLLATLTSLTGTCAALPEEFAGQFDLPDDAGTHDIEARADKPPGFNTCQRSGFRAPCAWQPTSEKGALECFRLEYTGRSQYPDISFGPDKGVTCKLYGGTLCEPIEPMMMISSPGGNLLEMGYQANKFPDNTVPGFYSARCRSYLQKKPDDKNQTRYIPLPQAP